MQIIERTNLWGRTLAAQPNDLYAAEREELRTALIKMRENVIPFVRNIHHDVLGLTVHDESHLDALWETADLISGFEFSINPAEAFVFGASILLHDTAMAVAAYPGGLADLRELDIWKDIEGQQKEANEQETLFAVLRHLHSQQAEELINLSFSSKVNPSRNYILENVRLRDGLGHAIGRIAHSHHWDANQLPERFHQVTGGIPGFPSEWTINELKVACLLRCADAAHIDARRAPTMLYAISKITGPSVQHWDFQNRLNSVALQGDKLVYTSGQPFGIEAAASWWLAYDTIGMIDRELKSCTAILEDSANPVFQAKAVLGSESPRLLARHVKVSGWTPVDAEVKVSDPVHLARTLGGRNLYGDPIFAPIREILQNAVDAVRARRIIENRTSSWGKIRVVIEPDSENSDITWLHVDDTGVGMSERVMTGPLIDFGSSLWSSWIVRDEFPGLQGRGNNPIGKFGIGFFSIFLLGSKVTVTSRKYNCGTDQTNVLEFDNLVRRPLLRRGVTGDLPLDYSTRVSVALSDDVSKFFDKSWVPDRTGNADLRPRDQIRRLICCVDIDIEFHDRIAGHRWNHGWDWIHSDPKAFISEVFATTDGERFDLDEIAANLDVLSGDDGSVYGRASYIINTPRDKYRPVPLLVSVGGFATANYSSSSFRSFDDRMSSKMPSRSAGVVVGETHDASRSTATVRVPSDVIAAWAERQASKIKRSDYLEKSLVGVCHDLMRCNADITNLPFAFASCRFLTWQELQLNISDSRGFVVPLDISKYNDIVSAIGFNAIGPDYYSNLMRRDVVVFSDSEINFNFLDHLAVRSIKESVSYQLNEVQSTALIRINYAISKAVEFLKELSPQSELEFLIKIDNLLDGGGRAEPIRRWVLDIRLSGQ